MERIINLHEKNLKSALKIMMAEADVSSFADLAKHVDMKETTFRSAVNNESFRVRDLLKTAESMGFDLILQRKSTDQ